MRKHLVPLGLALTAIAMRLPGVWLNGLSQDEVASARILREPTILRALHHVVRTESTPPLWYALGWLAHHAGVPIVEVRLLSVVFGALLAAGVFRLACVVVGPGYAALAGALVAVGYQPVYHGSELRSYELLALLATTLCILLVRSLEQPRRALDIALGATVWAGLLTHYFFAYALATALAWVWLDPAARALRRRVTLAIAAAGTCAAPWLPAFVVQYRHDRFWWIGPFSAREVIATPLRLFAPHAGEAVPLSLAVIGLTVFGAWRLGRASAAGRLVAALALAPIAAAGTAWAAGERTYAVRNLIETAPFLAAVVAAALAAVPARVAKAALATAAVAAVAGVAITRSTNATPPYQGIARALVAEGWRPSDPIAVFGNFFTYRAPLEWYLPHDPLLDVSRATRRECTAVFVIVGDEAPHRLPRRDVLRQRREGDYLVDRLDDVHAARLHGLRRATLLAVTHRSPQCVRLSTNPRLEPLA